MKSILLIHPGVLGVEIPKKSGCKRLLDLPTVEDRVAQTTVKLNFEPQVEPYFCEDSYGYRPNKSAHDAIAITRERCWKTNWVVEYDIEKFFDNLDHTPLMKAVNAHTNIPWVILYINRWLKAPMKVSYGETAECSSGAPQGGVISPILANLFLHYAFDKWMQREHPHLKLADTPMTD